MKEKQQKCVSESEVETHYERKTAKMCIQGRSGDTLQRENSKNVCQRVKWRHITEGKQKECVSESEVETHYERKTAKMCIQG